MNKLLGVLFFLLAIGQLSAQEVTIIEGLPKDLPEQTIILLKHEAIEVGSNEENEASREYVIHRQENHNRILEEFNSKLEKAAKEYYPFKYVLAFPSEVEDLLNEKAKYVFYSRVYQYEFLKNQPNEGELLVFGYYVKDKQEDTIYTTFELDEMKVYDAKMIIKKLAKEVKRTFPAKD